VDLVCRKGYDGPRVSSGGRAVAEASCDARGIDKSDLRGALHVLASSPHLLPHLLRYARGQYLHKCSLCPLCVGGPRSFPTSSGVGTDTMLRILYITTPLVREK
jgi:hypothetical protein